MHAVVRYVLVMVWFVAYMGAIYLALHMVVARLSRAPESRLLWFFSVVTGPLTRPMRAVLPPGTPEPRVRLAALVACLAALAGARLALARLGGSPIG